MPTRSIACCWLLAASLYSLPSPARAAGESPDNPLLWTIGTGALNVNVSQPGGAVWVRANFSVNTGTSHALVETLGSLDPVLYLYKDLADARVDKYLAFDDDSGNGFNARLTQSLGYPSPYFLRLRLYSNSATGSFQVSSSRVRQDPEDCPSAGPCALVAATRGLDLAVRILATARNLRTDLLRRTERGREIADLYYDLSRDVLWDVAADAELRREIYLGARELLPVLEELARAGLGQETGLRLSAREVEIARELSDLLLPRVNAANGRRLADLVTSFQLESLVGRPVAAVLRERGLLPVEPSPWVAAEGLQVARRGEVLVKFRGLASRRADFTDGRVQTGLPDLDGVLARYRADGLTPTFEGIAPLGGDLIQVYKVRLADDAEVPHLLADLAGHPNVVYAERNRRVLPLSDDVFFPFQWALENRQNPRADIQAPQAWSRERGQPSVLVAVVDTGIDYHYADFAGRVRRDIDHDYVDGDDDAMDTDGHGTHVAGILGASLDNSFSIAGVAPEISLVPFRVLTEDGGTWEAVAQGITAAAQAGARVINLSLGGPDPSAVVEDALRFAQERGAIVFAAAGNDGEGSLLYPASSTYTLAVGATDGANQLAYFSNYGQGLDLVAPGVDNVSLFQDGVACYASGTSMATPHASGVAALVASHAGSLPLSDLKQRLFEGAFDLGAPGYDTRFGWGLVDAENSLGTGGPPPGPSTCQPGPTTLCFLGNRFRLELLWRRSNGETGQGQTVPLRDRAGLFYFFNPDNLEMLAKMLNGCSINGHWWVFYAATTNTEFTLRVTDTQTGRFKEYVNPLNHTADPVQDLDALEVCP